MHAKNNKRKGLFLTVLATFCWGAGMVLSKKSLTFANEDILFLVQLISAWLSIFIIVLLGRNLSLKESKYCWLGILEPGIAFYLVLIGLQKTTAGNASILQALEGLMIVTLSFVLFRNKTKMMTIFWGIISTVGAVLVTLKYDSLGRFTTNSGDYLVLLGTLFAALYVTLSSRVIGQGNHAQSLLFWQLSICIPLMMLYQWANHNRLIRLDDFNIYAISSGILAYGLSFYFYLLGMQYISTSLSALMLFLNPIFGVLLSMLFLAETMSTLNILGVFIILVSSCYIAKLQINA